MVSSKLDELLARIQIESYIKNQPILKGVVERDTILSILMKIHNKQLSEIDIVFYSYLLPNLSKKNLITKIDNTYYLTDIGEEMIEKIEYELNLFENIENLNENKDIHDLLELACESIIRTKKSGFISHPLFYIIEQNYKSKKPLTPYFIGRSGLTLLFLYYLQGERKDIKWWFSSKDIKKFLFEIDCYDNFGNIVYSGYLAKLGLINYKKIRKNFSKYKLTEEGYNVAKFIIKNLDVVNKKYKLISYS
jgi:predicted transcriptional regulator